jgi:hypothetical protein
MIEFTFSEMEKPMVHNSRSNLFMLSVFVSLTFLGLTVPARADSCQPVFEALTKLVTTPRHSFTTHTTVFSNGGNPRTSETIYAQEKVYIRANGKWMNSPVTAAEVLEQEKENQEHGHATCQFVGNESVDGEAAMLYTMRREDADAKEDAQIWISKSRGLPLRDEQDVNVGGKAGKEHRSTRFEYTNIRPPL